MLPTPVVSDANLDGDLTGNRTAGVAGSLVRICSTAVWGSQSGGWVQGHVTVYRWGQRFTPLVIDAARPCRHACGDRWFVDESSVKVAGQWIYLYRAIDQVGQVIDVLAAQKRDMAVTR